MILLTDYTGSTGFGEKFAQAIKLDPLKTPGDELNQAVDEAIHRYPFIDGTRLCAAGASYGGHLANWIEATTTRYKCIISHAGEVDLTTQWGESDYIYEREVTNGGPPWAGNPIWREQSPLTYAANWKTPMLLSIGERDFRVPLGQHPGKLGDACNGCTSQADSSSGRTPGTGSSSPRTAGTSMKKCTAGSGLT